jgi:hypothetical protein
VTTWLDDGAQFEPTRLWLCIWRRLGLIGVDCAAIRLAGVVRCLLGLIKNVASCLLRLVQDVARGLAGLVENLGGFARLFQGFLA